VSSFSFPSLAAAEDYDAVVIGAGHNGLTSACYLAKAGLKVVVLEQYNSIGGMTITEEVTLPGFRSDIHAYGYQLANFSSAPSELELDKYGFELLYPNPSISHVFPGGGIISMYRDINKTVKSLERYSKKDAQTWQRMFNNYLSKKDKIIEFLNTPPDSGLPSHCTNSISTRSVEVAERKSFDEYRSNLQSLRSWCNEYFESEEAKVFFGTWAAHVSASPDDAGGGDLAYLFSVLVQDAGNNVVKGGMGNLSIALARYFQSKGGKISTSTGVSKIIINDKGKAVGVRLDNGTYIGVRRVVVSSIDPVTLAFGLIGEEYLEQNTIRNIKRYEWGDAVFTMYLALDHQMEYTAGSEALRSTHLHLSEPTLDYLAKVFYECRSGKLPSEPLFIVSNDSIVDPSRVPKDKHLMKFLISSVPYKIRKNNYGNEYNGSSQQYDWNEIKEYYSDTLIDIISQKYIPDLKGILRKKIVYSPLDLEKRPKTSVLGTLACGAMLPYQLATNRPIPQFASYKIPEIPNVYLCGSANHPGPGVSMAPGRNAAQIISADLGLRIFDKVW
jgi:phytoene dehydrogenase-like protein